jgi:hypothetical protein
MIWTCMCGMGFHARYRRRVPGGPAGTRSYPTRARSWPVSRQSRCGFESSSVGAWPGVKAGHACTLDVTTARRESEATG